MMDCYHFHQFQGFWLKKQSFTTKLLKLIHNFHLHFVCLIIAIVIISLAFSPAFCCNNLIFGTSSRHRKQLLLGQLRYPCFCNRLAYLHEIQVSQTHFQCPRKLIYDLICSPLMGMEDSQSLQG